MNDLDAIEYLRELKRFNSQGLMITPKNKEYSDFYQCAFNHSIRALEEKIQKNIKEN